MKTREEKRREEERREEKRREENRRVEEREKESRGLMTLLTTCSDTLKDTADVQTCWKNRQDYRLVKFY